jgi:type II secretory ATPase GspE/PulE/Tfp pilus assembly ATPase PilB-like protein
MLSSEGNPTDTAAIGKQVPFNTDIQEEQGRNDTKCPIRDGESFASAQSPHSTNGDGVERPLRDYEQVFQLIENILSFEACLYHQILPLKKEDNNFLLGMVNPQDSAALDYVNRVISYMNCTMVTQPITDEIHRKILSAYLNYKNTSLAVTKPTEKSSDFSQQDEVTTIGDQLNSRNTQPKSNQQSIWELGQPQTSKSSITQSSNPSVFSLKTEATSGTETINHLPVLQAPIPEQFTPIEELAALPPKKLLEQLLGRVLLGGIGRLYLERQPFQGRILWSENGVLQSVLEKLPLSVFQGVLNELKRFASLPITTLAEPKQVEKECLYQQDRLLLRLRVMSGMHGEEATLQVLRGAALKFYQQQQLARLSRDTLAVSQQLSYKLHELKQRLVLSQNLNSGQLEVFNALNQLLQNLDHQVRILTEIPELPKRQK